MRAILMDPRFRQVIPQTLVIASHVLCQCVATDAAAAGAPPRPADAVDNAAAFDEAFGRWGCGGS
jgi:hypothetical protein